jgi:tripartite-type tricarboxylate transporter receptor subunit TctC
MAKGGWNGTFCDIAPVPSIYHEPFVLGVKPSVVAKTLPEFIAYAKANPGKLYMASSLFWTPQDVAHQLFKMMTGVPCVGMVVDFSRNLAL